MTARIRWPLAIVGLLVTNMLAMATLVGSSTSSTPQVVDGYDGRSGWHAIATAMVRALEAPR